MWFVSILCRLVTCFGLFLKIRRRWRPSCSTTALKRQTGSLGERVQTWLSEKSPTGFLIYRWDKPTVFLYVIIHELCYGIWCLSSIVPETNRWNQSEILGYKNKYPNSRSLDQWMNFSRCTASSWRWTTEFGILYYTVYTVHYYTDPVLHFLLKESDLHKVTDALKQYTASVCQHEKPPSISTATLQETSDIWRSIYNTTNMPQVNICVNNKLNSPTWNLFFLNTRSWSCCGQFFVHNKNSLFTSSKAYFLHKIKIKK